MLKNSAHESIRVSNVEFGGMKVIRVDGLGTIGWDTCTHSLMAL